MLFEIKDLDNIPEEAMKAKRSLDPTERHLYRFNLSSNVYDYYSEYMDYRYAQSGRTNYKELRIWGLGVSEDKSLPDNHYELVKRNE